MGELEKNRQNPDNFFDTEKRKEIKMLEESLELEINTCKLTTFWSCPNCNAYNKYYDKKTALRYYDKKTALCRRCGTRVGIMVDSQTGRNRFIPILDRRRRLIERFIRESNRIHYGDNYE